MNATDGAFLPKQLKPDRNLVVVIVRSVVCTRYQVRVPGTPYLLHLAAAPLRRPCAVVDSTSPSSADYFD